MDEQDTSRGNAGVASAFQSGWNAQGQRDDAKKTAKNTLKTAQKPTGLQTTRPALTALIPSMKSGGRVKKTGLVLLHRGEHVVPAKRSKKTSSKRTIIKP